MPAGGAVRDYASALLALREDYRAGRLAVADYLARTTAIWNEVLALGLADDLHDELERRRAV